MGRHALFNIGRVLLGAALLSCVESDRVTSVPTRSPQASALASPLPAGRLLWQKESSEQHSVWVLDPAAWASYPIFVLIPQYVPTGWKIVGTGDFNADGDADIVWENPTATPKNTVWWMQGNVYSTLWDRVRDVFDNDAPKVWSITAVGDFDKDGKPDLVWVNTETGEHTIWYMNGTKAVRYGDFGPMSKLDLVWRIVGTGDFDGDGQIDLVWENLTERQHNLRRSIWYLNQGTYTGRYKMLDEIDVPDGWSIAAVGDVDRDGMPDLVWQNSSTGQHSIWFMNRSSLGHSVVLQPTLTDPEWSIAGVLATAPPTTGAIRVVTVTTGELPDPTGYTISVTTASGLVETTNIGTSSFVVFTRPAGSFTATLGDIATNCTTTNNPRTVTVSAGLTTETRFDVSCPAPATPAPPANLTAVASSDGSIHLTWADNSNNETGFRIEQCVNVGCTSFLELRTVVADKTSEPITNVLAGTSYTYRIRAYNGAGNSAYSNNASATGTPRKVRIVNSAVQTITLHDVVRLKLAVDGNGLGNADLLSDDRFTSCQSLDNINYVTSTFSQTFNQTIGNNYLIYMSMGVWQTDPYCSTIPFVWSRLTSFQTSPTGPLRYVYVAVNITGHTSGTVDFAVTGSYLNGTMKVQVSQGGANWGPAIFFTVTN